MNKLWCINAMEINKLIVVNGIPISNKKGTELQSYISSMNLKNITNDTICMVSRTSKTNLDWHKGGQS